MSLKYLLLIPISIITILLFTACSDDDPTTPEPVSDILLTLHLNDYHLEYGVTEGLVFASDTEGNVLDVAPWSGTSTVVLKNSDIHPKTISFTVFQYSERGLSLATQLGVPVGSVETLTGYTKPPLAGSAEVTFLDVPLCWRYRMAYNWYLGLGWSDFPASQKIGVHGSSTDFFVRVDPIYTPPLGGWLHDLKPGDTDTLDFGKFENVAPLIPKLIQIPSGGDRILCRIDGLVEIDSTRTFLKLDSQSIDSPIPESIVLYPPEFDPSNLVTMFYQSTRGNPDSYYWQEFTGPVPASFTNLEGELSVNSTSPDSVSFTTTSTWDWLTTYWYQKKELSCSWLVKGPAPIQTFALPRLPGEITELFPDYPREGFTLNTLEIYQDTTENLVRSQGKDFPPVGTAGSDPMTRRRWDPKAPWGALSRF